MGHVFVRVKNPLEELRRIEVFEIEVSSEGDGGKDPDESQEDPLVDSGGVSSFTSRVLVNSTGHCG